MQGQNYENNYGIIEGVSGAYAGQRMRIYPGETIWFGSDPRSDAFLEEDGILPCHCGISYDDAARCFWVLCEDGAEVYDADGALLPEGREVKLHAGEMLRIGRSNEVFCLFAQTGTQQVQKKAAARRQNFRPKYLIAGAGTAAALLLVFFLVRGIWTPGGEKAVQSASAPKTGTGTALPDLDGGIDLEEQNASNHSDVQDNDLPEEAQEQQEPETAVTEVQENTVSQGNSGQESQDTADIDHDAGLMPDASKGSYQLSMMSEQNGWLYYQMEAEDNRFVICRRSADGSGDGEVFITRDDVSYGRMMITEQYIYVRASYPAKVYLEQFNHHGQQVGSIELPNSEFVWEDGYFYYVKSNGLYRLKAEPEGKEELLGEDPIPFGFQVYEGKIYYVTNETIRGGQGYADFVSIHTDGSERQVIRELDNSFLYESLGSGFSYRDGIYAWYMDYQLGCEVLSRVGMDGSVETLLSAEQSGGCRYDSTNRVIPVGNQLVFERTETAEPSCSDSALGIYNLDTGEESLLLFESEIEEGCFGYTPVYVQNASGVYYLKEGGSMDPYLSFCRISTNGRERSDFGEGLVNETQNSLY